MRKLFLIIIIFLITSFSFPVLSFATQAADDVKKAQIFKQMHSVQVPFIENKGQIKNDDIRFYANTFSGTIFVAEDGSLTYNFPAEDSKGVVIKEIFTDKKIKIEGVDPSPTKVSYFKGKDKEDWKSNLSSYNKIFLGEVYKGIEVSLQVHGNNVEKLFTVSPNQNPDQIRIQVNGSDELKINENDELEVITELGAVEFTKPIAYQQINNKKISVEVAYTVKQKNTYGFRIGNYDKSMPLIIDPLIASTFIGGSGPKQSGLVGAEEGNSIALDKNGNVYVTGYTYSLDYPTTSGSYDESCNEDDVFISKLDSNLSTLIACTFIGGSGDEDGYSIIITDGGKVYVTGDTDSSDFPTTSGAYDISIGGVFISKLNSDLSTLLASTRIGGGYIERSRSIALDDSGNVYVTGEVFDSSSAEDYPTTPGAYDEIYNGSGDVFISKLNSNLGKLLASTFVGGSKWDRGYSIAIDKNENVYVTGSTDSRDFPSPVFFDPGFGPDVFIVKFNSSLNTLLSSNIISGWKDECGYSIAIDDNNNNVYVTGDTDSHDFPTTSGAYDEDIFGYSDNGFILKLNSSLTLLASTFIGKAGTHSRSIALDGSSNVYITGYSGIEFPTTSGAYSENFNGGSFDVFISKLNSNLSSLLASTFIGGSEIENAYSIAIDHNDKVYVTGVAFSADFPTTTGAYDKSYNSYGDVFISKLDSKLSNAKITGDSDVDGYTKNQGDCNDNDNSIYPGAIEICDGIDNDCDGSIDEDGACQTCSDADGDGYYFESDCGTQKDCNDNDNKIHPGAIEIPDDGIDQNCDGQDETSIGAPTPPRGLAANAVSYRKIQLRWTDQSDDEDGFKIERKERGCNSSNAWSQIATVSGDNKYDDTDFEPDTQYSYRVRAYKGLTNSGYSNCGTTTASASGTPSAPVNLVATYVSTLKIDLTWEEWSSNVDEFKIYREKNDSDSWTLLATLGASTLKYSDTRASGNQSATGYCYYVQACNDKGCSPPTYSVCVPFNPTSLKATSGTNGKIVLEWQDNSDNERGFEIYRKEGGCSSTASWEKLKQAGIDRETVSDKKDLVSGTTYSYKIRAYCRSWGLPYVYGYSNWSNCISITAP